MVRHSARRYPYWVVLGRLTVISSAEAQLDGYLALLDAYTYLALSDAYMYLVLFDA